MRIDFIFDACRLYQRIFGKYYQYLNPIALLRFWCLRQKQYLASRAGSDLDSPKYYCCHHREIKALNSWKFRLTKCISLLEAKAQQLYSKAPIYSSRYAVEEVAIHSRQGSKDRCRPLALTAALL